ncbi:MAG TPA: glutaredoxin 3 [Gammaproteobacteria bacterium]|nr:glutaredoxin 3 [Gammaproteobacteria bacterium]
MTQPSQPTRYRVEIYTWRYCPYCIAAKQLLVDKGVEFVEHAIDGDSTARAAMAERANGRHTVPQIFIDDRAIGGFRELAALDRSGALGRLLGR